MAKMEMRVIPEPAEGTREVLSAHGAGSMAIKGVGSISFLCDIVFKCKGCGAFNEVKPTTRVGYAPEPTEFEVDDRVAVRGEPERCGTVKGVMEDTRDYEISWDAHAGGPLAVGMRGEEELMPCPHNSDREWTGEALKPSNLGPFPRS